MGASDGTVLGLTTILNNGPNNLRFNIVLVAEGFRNTTAEQNAFNQRCQDVVNAFLAEPWFGAGLLAAVNIHRLNVGSNDSGADDPMTCGDASVGTGTSAATYFDASYCTDGIRRCLGVDWNLVRTTLTAALPNWHAAAVVVNSTQRGGCARGNVFATALSADFIDVVLHELGHAAFGLGDEYSYWRGCNSGETDRNNAPAVEPGDPNVTGVGTLGGLKWASLVQATTPVPTMENPDCSNCDTRANVRADNTEIGLFEGSGYYHCGYYRPAYTCRMRDSSKPFCRVCAAAVRDVLDTFFGTTPGLAASAAELNFGQVAVGGSLTMNLDVANVGTTNVTGVTVALTGAEFTAAPVALGTLVVGAVRNVAVTFAPVGANGPRTGTVTITSSAPTITVDLKGGACTPNPTLSAKAADGGSTLLFGDVARRLTTYRWFEVRNLRVGCVGPAVVNLQAPTGGFAYAPGTPMSFVLPAPTPSQSYTARRVYVSFTSPATGGPNFNGTLSVTSPGLANLSLTMTARAVDPPPVDTVLVIDRSGSMSEATGVPGSRKIDLAMQAVDLYVGLVGDNDRLGLVRFNNSAANPTDVLQTLVTAGDPTTGAGRAAVRGHLNATELAPIGATSIGGGALLGSTVLDAAVANARAVIVLTDGLQNTAPDIATARAAVTAKTPRQRVFAIGLGLNQLEDSLVQLASTANGTAHITGELVADREFLLQKLYVQILTDVSDLAFVEDPVEVVVSGVTKSTDVWIGDVDVAADFVVAYRNAPPLPAVQVWLEAPDGTVIRPPDTGTVFPNAQFVSHPGHFFFRVQFPVFPDRPDAHVGRWRIWVGAGSAPQRELMALAKNDGRFVYSPMITARSNLLLRAHIRQPAYAPGTPMTVVLEPECFGLPIALDEPVEVVVTRPDGVARTVAVTRQDSGTYEGMFTDTWLVGAYQAIVRASATTPLGNRVTRYRTMTGIIYLPGGNGGTNGGNGGNGGKCGNCCRSSDDCDRSKGLLDRLEAMLKTAEDLTDAERDAMRAVVERLRVVVSSCCGCRPVR